MKFIASREHMTKALSRLAGLVKPIGDIPHTALLHIAAFEETNAVQFTVADHVARATVTVEAEVEREGETCVSNQQPSQFLSGFNSEDIQVGVGGNQLHFAGDNESFTLPLTVATEFPSEEMGADFTLIDGKSLAAALRVMMPTVARPEETRDFLKGISFDPDGSDLLVRSSDGRRVAMISIPAEIQPASVLVHEAPLRVLSEWFVESNDCQMAITPGKVYFRDATSFQARVTCSAAQMPIFSQLYNAADADQSGHCLVNRVALLDALRMVNYTAQRGYAKARLVAGPRYLVIESAADPNSAPIGNFRRSLSTTDLRGQGIMNLQPRFLLGELSAITEETVRLMFVKDHDRMVVTTPELPTYRLLIAGMKS